MRTFRWMCMAAMVVVVVFTMAVVSVRAEVGLKVEDSSGGDSVRVPITISSAAGVTGLQFRFNFDPAVLSVADGKLLTLGETASGWNAQTNHGEGWITAVMFNPRLKPMKKESGVIGYIALKVNKSSAEGGSSPLRLTGVVIADNKGNAMPFTISNGTFTRKPASAPEVNKPER